MGTSIREASAVLATTLCCCAAGAQVPQALGSYDIPSYYDSIAKLSNDYINGYRVSSITKQWDSLKYDPKTYYVYKCIATHGEGTWLIRGISSSSVSRAKDVWANVISRDVVYMLEQADDKKDTYQVGLFKTEWESPDTFMRVFSSFPAVKQIYIPVSGDAIAGVVRSQYEGKEALKIDVKTRSGTSRVVYLDGETYQFLYDESSDSANPKTQLKDGGKQVARMTYRAVNGKQIPARYERYHQPPEGSNIPLMEIEFTEYVPYTPTADELDLEKQFGIKPIPHEPRPASAMPPTGGGRAVWLYAAAGVLAAVAAGLVAWSRRRRIAT